MRITIINGTNKMGNKTINISQVVNAIAKKLGNETYLVTLDNFDQLFRGEHIRLENANENQKKDMRNMIETDVLLFVVPTYHSGIPSPLKNFLDSVKEKALFENKIIGIIAANDSNQNLGARQARQVINGILAYNKAISFVVPIIPIIDFEEIDSNRIEEFIHYCSQFIDRHDKRKFIQAEH